MPGLIFPFLAELARLDPSTTEYDADFAEPVAGGRRELPPIRIRAQVEPAEHEDPVQAAAGTVPRSRMGLVFDWRDLERTGLVDPSTGGALLRPGDRLVAIYDLAGRVVQVIRTPPGLYLTEARPIGFGLFRRRPQRRLLLATFHDRPQGLRRT